MARWRMYLLLLLVMVALGGLATWRIASYPREYRLAHATARPLLALRGVQALAALGALAGLGLFVYERLKMAGEAPRLNWLCPGCSQIVSADHDVCPLCGCPRGGLRRI
ncbi:MAG: hypothetical protein ACOX3S_14205 [Anaerolineae bacterium]|jgi:hypothetical protein